MNIVLILICFIYYLYFFFLFERFIFVISILLIFKNCHSIFIINTLSILKIDLLRNFYFQVFKQLKFLNKHYPKIKFQIFIAI